MVLPGALGLQVFGIASTLAVGSALYFAMGQSQLSPFAPLALIVWVLGSLLVSLAKPIPHETAGARMAWLIAGPLYIGGTLAGLSALHRVPHGGAWVMLSMMLAWFADTVGYFAGRFLGGKLFGAQQDVPQHLAQQDLGGCGRRGVRGTGRRVLWRTSGTCPICRWPVASPWRCCSGPLGVCGDLVESLDQAQHRHQGQRLDRARPRRPDRPHRRADVHRHRHAGLRARFSLRLLVPRRNTDFAFSAFEMGARAWQPSRPWRTRFELAPSSPPPGISPRPSRRWCAASSRASSIRCCSASPAAARPSPSPT